MHLLVLNAGSSSLKFQLFDKKTLAALYHGHIDGINLKTCVYREKYHHKGQIIDRETKISCPDHNQALKIGLKKLQSSGILTNLQNIAAVGHRVVHGGEKFKKSVIISPKILRTLTELQKIAPLHNPPNLAAIHASQELLPKLPNIVVFDTAFHQSIPEHAYLYALPYSWYQKYGIRRYGFHGTSHSFVSSAAIAYLKKQKRPWQKIISCHLGNGASITAIKNGQSIDTSMGFTPLEGIPMGTRCGDIDPAIISFIKEHKGKTVEQITNILNHASGLQGISGLSSDMRLLRDAWFQNKNPRAKLALDIYCYRIAKYIGSYLTALHGLDCLIFTGGIGEFAWYIRAWICQYLKFFGAHLNKSRNLKNSWEISSSKSRITILVIPTNEELEIARQTRALMEP